MKEKLSEFQLRKKLFIRMNFRKNCLLNVRAGVSNLFYNKERELNLAGYPARFTTYPDILLSGQLDIQYPLSQYPKWKIYIPWLFVDLQRVSRTTV